MKRPSPPQAARGPARAAVLLLLGLLAAPLAAGEKSLHGWIWTDTAGAPVAEALELRRAEFSTRTSAYEIRLAKTSGASYTSEFDTGRGLTTETLRDAGSGWTATLESDSGLRNLGPADLWDFDSLQRMLERTEREDPLLRYRLRLRRGKTYRFEARPSAARNPVRELAEALARDLRPDSLSAAVLAEIELLATIQRLTRERRQDPGVLGASELVEILATALRLARQAPGEPPLPEPETPAWTLKDLPGDAR